MSEVHRRKSIHHDEKHSLDDKTNKELSKCESCEKSFLVEKDGTETKLEEDEVSKWVNLQKKKDVDIDSKNLRSFKCKGCKSSEVTTFAKSPWKSVWFVLICIFAVCSICIFIGVNNEESMYHLKRSKDIPINPLVKTQSEQKLENEMELLEKLYRNQIEDTWITLVAGITSVIRENPNQPSMFLLLFDSESAGKTAQCIAQAVSKQAIQYLMKKSDTPEVVNGADYNQRKFLDDPGEVLKVLNDTVREKGALVVTNLHEVPPNVAQMFHFICDKYSPLVETAVTFFTLKVNQMPSQKDQQKTAEETMNKLWASSLDDNVLRPLITRMTTNIIRINPDPYC